MLAQTGILREKVLAAAYTCFGHRMMMDGVVPGGVERDLKEDGIKVLKELVVTLRREFPPLIKLYDNKLSLQDRTMTTGVVRAALIHRFAAGGFVGRGSARSFDARRVPSYPPYDDMDFEIPVFSEGDVNARVWVRIREIEVSLSIVDRLLTDNRRIGPIHADIPARSGEGMALVEGFRGDILTWVRLGTDGRVLRCHPRDPSWFQWPLLEAAIEGNIVADFPLCNKSFNCSYSGQDL
jgi:Ni,Fe-hydrogenase III large subunit